MSTNPFKSKGSTVFKKKIIKPIALSPAIPSQKRKPKRFKPRKSALRDLTKTKESQELYKAIKMKITEFATQANDIIHKQLPSNILHFHNLSKTHPLLQPSFEQEIRARHKALLANATNPGFPDADGPLLSSAPPEAAQFQELLQAEMTGLMATMAGLKHWIETNQPRTEDADHLKVEIQNSVASQLKMTEASLAMGMNVFLQYYQTRGDVLHAIRKHGARDFYTVLMELDAKLCRSVRFNVMEFRNHLILLRAILLANLKHLKRAETLTTMGSLF
eukprot:gnl/Dysnectes_brevis/671_a739_3476.p1 GENE.gnl/Dysnectes_brevis/671_a739_3476~~gnl/Dysnectes_brevis/671_a739_3476.p1  ORF type:complete len:286 (-),score=64.08 gnl/Dysnectes_brevis/671_a739_3476:124-951(-)